MTDRPASLQNQQLLPALTFRDDDLADPKKAAKLIRDLYSTVGVAFERAMRLVDNDPRMNDRRHADFLYGMAHDIRIIDRAKGLPGDVLTLVDQYNCVFASSATPGPGGVVPAAAAHDILSATHSDSLAAGVSRGSLIYGNATPKWAELVIGAAGQVLTSDGTDASWQPAAGGAEVEELGIYGDGVDGDVTLDGAATPSGTSRIGNDYFLTRDVCWNDVTINAGKTLDTSGYRLFINGTLTNNGTIKADGAAGSNGANAAGSGTPAGGTGGAASTAVFTVGANTGGGNGHAGQTGAGVSGNNAITAIGEGGPGGGGGRGENSNSGAAGGAAGGASLISVCRARSTTSILFIQDYSATYALVQGGTGGKGGASGAGDGASRGAGGGGGGAGGRVCAIWARFVVNAGLISANGGVGGNGGNTDGSAGAGGGGGGGGGGFLWLYYDTLTGAGTITAAAGAGGNVGTQGTGGTAGTNGSNGTAGTVIKYSRLTGLFT